jgi:hypothetical protein
MNKCQWGECTNHATKVVQRMATDREQREGSIMNERGVIVPMLVKKDVCDDHIKEAQHE